MYLCMYLADGLAADSEMTKNTAQYTILLPGKALHLSALNNARKFRNKGNKDGGLQAFQMLEKEGLGKIESYTIPSQKTKVHNYLLHTYVCVHNICMPVHISTYYNNPVNTDLQPLKLGLLSYLLCGWPNFDTITDPPTIAVQYHLNFA